MRTRTALVAAMTAAALVISPQALADPLDPDPSFGGDGIVRSDRWGLHKQMALTSDRRLLFVGGVAATGISGSGSIFAQKRARHGASLGETGYTLATSSVDSVRDILLRPHRVLVVGWSTPWSPDESFEPYGFVIASRRNLKQTRFGNTGVQRLREVDFGSVTGGAIDSQGRVLVTGRLDGQTAVLRLTRDGHIDTSYGTNGLARVTIGTGSSPRDIAVHGTTAVVVGNTTINGHKQGFATQITGYGYRDRAFSGDGIRLIGKRGSYVSEVQPADAGRWLIAYESGKRAGVTKIGATGDLIGTFGRHGRASIRCTRPDKRVVDALTVDRKDGALHRVALATSCKRSGDLRRLASIWRPGGQPITSLRPDATARLPWGAHTIDITYGWRGRLTALIPYKIVRLR